MTSSEPVHTFPMWSPSDKQAHARWWYEVMVYDAFMCRPLQSLRHDLYWMEQATPGYFETQRPYPLCLEPYIVMLKLWPEVKV